MTQAQGFASAMTRGRHQGAVPPMTAGESATTMTPIPIETSAAPKHLARNNAPLSGRPVLLAMASPR